MEMQNNLLVCLKTCYVTLSKYMGGRVRSSLRLDKKNEDKREVTLKLTMGRLCWLKQQCISLLQ